MKYRIILVGLVLLSLVVSANAGSERRIGTAGAQELLIPIGSRGTAMGGAVVANTFGVEALYWNPAGIAGMEHTEVMFTHQPYLADIDVNYFGVGHNIEGFGTIGLSAKIVSIGEIEETTEDQPEGTGSVYEPTLSVIGLTYASVLTSNVQFGATAHLINERIFEVSATGMAFDFGVIYDPKWKGLTLGIVIKNYGPEMTFSGVGFERSFEEAGQRRVSPSSAKFELPSSINIGLAYNFLNMGQNSMALVGNFRSNNFQEDFWQGGAEYAFNNTFFLRAGYNYSEQREYLYGASLGAGLSYPIGEDTRLTVEYSWTQTEVFDDNQYFTVKASF